MHPALDLAHQIIEVAERQDDPTYQLVAYRMLGTNQFYAGRNREALESLQRGKKYRDPRRQRALSYRFGWDPSLAVLCFEVLVRLSLGLLDSAAQLSEQVRAGARSHGHATTIASATFCARNWPKLVLGDLEGLERDSAELAAYCAEKKVEQIRLLASFHLCLCPRHARTDRGNIAAHRAALDAVRSAGGLIAQLLILSNLAEASLMAGDRGARRGRPEDGFAFVEQSGERYLACRFASAERACCAETARARSAARGSLLHKSDRGRPWPGSPLLELRAATDLARLWRDTRSDGIPARCWNRSWPRSKAARRPAMSAMPARCLQGSFE